MASFPSLFPQILCNKKKKKERKKKKKKFKWKYDNQF